MASLIILQAIVRLFVADSFHTFTGFVLTLYLLVFGICIFMIEFTLKRARVWFYFMNFALGKALFYIVMTLLCFGSGASINWFDILVGIICGIVAVVFIFFHIWHKGEEAAHVETLIEQMNVKLGEAGSQPPPAGQQIPGTDPDGGVNRV